jgi:molybdopterin-guanine dinucleotide biosynthesis protein A
VAAPLYGLVLAGGRSRRMGEDKAALRYAGRTQLERAMSLIAPHVARAYVSVRREQRADPVRAAFAQIEDRLQDVGPIAGVLAAQAQHPEAAWLVLACDLPLLDATTLAHLVAARDASAPATAYRSSHDGLPEPLCAIYEPRSRLGLQDYVAAGGNCPRKFLINSGARLLEEPNPRALDNINTPQEYAVVSGSLTQEGAISAKHLTVHYYALLREQAGRREEAVESSAANARELYAELAARYPFTLPAELLRVAINAEFAEWSAPLREGDEVVFLPPVAGG